MYICMYICIYVYMYTYVYIHKNTDSYYSWILRNCVITLECCICYTIL